MNYYKMKAFGVSVLVKPVYKTKTDGGLEIPESEYKNPANVHKGTVISVGDGNYLNNKLEMKLEEGDTVFYRGSVGIPYRFEEDEFKILQITDVLAKEVTNE
jgi:co-chaperonin GroES (HSP10)